MGRQRREMLKHSASPILVIPASEQRHPESALQVALNPDIILQGLHVSAELLEQILSSVFVRREQGDLGGLPVVVLFWKPF